MDLALNNQQWLNAIKPNPRIIEQVIFLSFAADWHRVNLNLLNISSNFVAFEARVG